MEFICKVEEHLFGITLDHTNPEKLWDPDTREGELYLAHKLLLTQIHVGFTAIKDETNIIELTSPTKEGEVTVPLVTLKAGKTNILLPRLLLPESPVTFRLVQGRGPIHIIGRHDLCYTKLIVKNSNSIDDDLTCKEDMPEQDNETDDSCSSM